ncbi:TPA: hypothetical protein SL272_000854 [Pseudomonas aeruginosa]|nr:hypothetical protein [Pseudomonas aeruginosa]
MSAESNLLTQIALAMLRSWYVTWDQFQASKHGEIRRCALHSKTRGVIHHDRVLNQEVRHG